MSELNLAQEVIERLSGIPAQLRQLVADAMWARIPTTVNEWVQFASTAAGEYAIQAQTAQWEKIDLIMWNLPTGGGTLHLGTIMAIPLPAGFGMMGPGLRIVMGPSDRRSIVTTQTGAVFVMLAGDQEPTTGVLAP